MAWHFTEIHTDEKLAKNDWLNSLKESIKDKYPGLYPTLVNLIAPVHSSFKPETYLKKFPPGSIILNLGAGTTRLSDDIINVDVAPYKSVHIVSDLKKLPIRSNSVDAVVNIAVLEHVPDPVEVVAEFLRILKPGGELICFVPFMQGFHASPFDFQRYTEPGLRVLFDKFEIDRVIPIGPTSGLIWLLQEWLAMALSFGSLNLYKLILPATWMLSPLKYLDILLTKHPAATNIASGHYLFARKPAASK